MSDELAERCRAAAYKGELPAMSATEHASINVGLLRRCAIAASVKEAITLSDDESTEWAQLIHAWLGAEYWSWRIQDRDWKNNGEPLRFATKTGAALLGHTRLT